MSDEKMVMTVRIQKDVAEQFNKLIGEIGLRRDTYLNRLLPREVELLSELPPNSERAARFSKLSAQWFEDQKTRLGLKLDTALVQRINDVCREKGIVRDAFIGTFLEFLVDGYEGDSESVGSPLGKVFALIEDPYYEAYAGNINIYKRRLHLDDSWFEVEGPFKDALTFGSGRGRKGRETKEDA